MPWDHQRILQFGQHERPGQDGCMLDVGQDAVEDGDEGY
jgi:hypothetical protein